MAITAGSGLNAVVAPQQQALASNYIDFTDGSTGWEQQYLPDLMEKKQRFSVTVQFLDSYLKLVQKRLVHPIRLYGLNKVDYIYLT